MNQLQSPATLNRPSKARWTLGSILWLAALTIMASFQTWRGAYEDGIVFSVLVVLLIIDRSLGERLSRNRKALQLAPWAIWLVAVLFGIVLIFAPRHSSVVFGAMALIGVMMLVVAWPDLSATKTDSTPAIRRSAWGWAVVGISLCVWEATAFVLSVTMPGGSQAHPTISVLLDPALETVIGRTIFVGLWLLAGVGLVFIWRRK